ncbi:MAG: hypothetical protein M1816_000903 [Peltula sp. TS41687]|nr:MAG: hypothetical protein M1816_000903 [Peltula sp. TS41687]
MFRRLSSSLPKDPKYPANLKELGYFVTDTDEIKSIANPEEEFVYFIDKNERYNETHKEAMNICIRELVLQRMADLDINILRLPLGTPSSKPHIPILASKDLSKKKRVILVFNEAMQDLGIWAYRMVNRSGPGSINRGSAVAFAKNLQSYATSSTEKESPGLVLANLGQLLWWRGGKQAVSFVTWNVLPRKTAVHGPMRIDGVKNRVPGNESLDQHVQYMFDEVMAKITDKDVKIDIVGLSDGGSAVIKFLNDNWAVWSSRIAAIALGTPLYHTSEITNPSFAEFLKARARGYVCSPLEPNTLIPDENFGCPTFASGEEFYTECVMPAANKLMLDFFNDVAMQGEDFRNPIIEIYGPDPEEDEFAVGKSANAA